MNSEFSYLSSVKNNTYKLKYFYAGCFQLPLHLFCSNVVCCQNCGKTQAVWIMYSCVNYMLIKNCVYNVLCIKTHTHAHTQNHHHPTYYSILINFHQIIEYGILIIFLSHKHMCMNYYLIKTCFNLFYKNLKT